MELDTNNLIYRLHSACDAAINALETKSVDVACDLLMDAMFLATDLQAPGLRRKLQSIRFNITHNSSHMSLDELKALFSHITDARKAPIEKIRRL